MGKRPRERQLALFRDKLAQRPDGGFGCQDLFPGVEHCSICHGLEVAPFGVSDRQGRIHGCCCAGVQTFIQHGLARDPSFYPAPVSDDHLGRLRAWITR